jgi:dTDP-4-dehydrorhamnose reductase
MKILLFGCNGQVGWELQRSLLLLGELVALDFNDSHYGADFRHPGALARTIRAIQPDAIVNAAAHTAVDAAEADPALAHTINAEAPAVLAREATALNAWLVHYSTDYVFDGSGERPWTEDDPMAPLNVYGRTKLEGERRVRASGCRHLILRTSWVYSARGDNFARTMIKLAGEREQIDVVADQIGAPTGADLLADVTAHTLRSAIVAPELSGTYHVVAGGETSWHGYARLVIEWARTEGYGIRVTDERIQPVLSSAYPTVARRPLNSRLDSQRLRRIFGLKIPHWRLGVLRMLAELRGS